MKECLKQSEIRLHIKPGGHGNKNRSRPSRLFILFSVGKKSERQRMGRDLTCSERRFQNVLPFVKGARLRGAYGAFIKILI